MEREGEKMKTCNGCSHLYNLSGFDYRGMECFCKHPAMLSGAKSLKHFEIDGKEIPTPDWCPKEKENV